LSCGEWDGYDVVVENASCQLWPAAPYFFASRCEIFRPAGGVLQEAQVRRAMGEDTHTQQNFSQKLRIALIVDSNISSKYVYDLACWAKEQNDLEVSSLIIQKTQFSSFGKYKRGIESLKKRGVACLLEQIGYSFLVKIEQVLLKRNLMHKDHFNQYNLFDYVNDIIDVEPIISKSGFVYRYSDNDIQNIKQKNIDVLIRCGSGILRGDILTIAKYGIISFHHADNKINRGGPPGFWEVFNREDSTGFTIQQLTDELDGGNVLFQGCIATSYYYLLNQANLYIKANFYMKKILSDLAATKKLPEKLDSFPYFNQLHKRPSLLIQFIYIFNLTNIILNKVTRRFLLKKHYRWGVAFKFTNWRNLVMWKAIKIKNPVNHFLADPFVISDNEKTYCFVEDYDYTLSRGCISLYELNETKAIRHGEIISESFHMSYPYVFEYQSKFYMVPETCQNRDIRLYEAEDFPHKWKFSKTIFKDIDAADTTIFEKDGLWWLFTNIDPVNSGDHGVELFIFYSDNPLSEKWTSHPKNPVICNSLKARMGGIVFDNNFIYRVSQKQGFDMYGKASNISKIVHLSTTDYSEELEFTIEPNFFNNLEGTHHIHGNNNVTVFDFVEKSKLN
jgi:hypothetical protein